MFMREAPGVFDALARSGRKPDCVVEERILKRGRYRRTDVHGPAWFLGVWSRHTYDGPIYSGYALCVNGKLYRGRDRIGDRKDFDSIEVGLKHLATDCLGFVVGAAKRLAEGGQAEHL
jgi:hypothetical protein